MATDAILGPLQVSVTKTATFTGAALLLPTGTRRWGLKAKILYSAATNASGSNSVTFSLQFSRDGGTTYFVEAQSDPINLTTTAQSGELWIPFDVSPLTQANGVNVQLVATFGGAGSTPTIQYQGDLVLSRP